MDTEKHIYFWVEQTTKIEGNVEAIVGLDFDGGLNAIGRDITDVPLWLVSESGVTAFLGRVALVHQQRTGFHLRLLEGALSCFPCLLTSDPNARQMYHGPVSITAANLPMSLEEAIGAGIPLRGRKLAGHSPHVNR